MHSRVRDHIRANIVGCVALFFALSLGTAWALERNSVQSKHIRNGQVKSADVKNDGVKGKDIDESTLGPLSPTGPAGGDLTGSYPDPSIANGAVTGTEVLNDSITGTDIGGIAGPDVIDNSLTGSDVVESSLGQVTSALLGGFGRTGTEATCDPESTTFVTCAATGAINVPPGARALVLARVRASTEVDSDTGVGNCRLGTSSVGAVPESNTLFVVDDDGDDQNAVESATLIGVSPPLTAGSTDFGIDCNQSGGAIDYDDVAVTAVLITSS